VTDPADYLSPAWFERLRVLADDLPVQPGVSGRIAHVVSGAPDGDVAYVVGFVDGRLTEAARGEAPDAAVATTRTYADGLRIARGELDEAAAFMQGRLKLTGHMGTFLDLQRVTQSPAWHAATAALAAETVAP
jgi:predicted lipid carrier protein YhbT